jgi:hypothetical protein
MDSLRIEVSCLFILLISITCAHAEEDRYCRAEDWSGPAATTRIATWSAGSVTKGMPSELRLAFDSPDSECGGAPCFARGGVSGVEVRRAGSSVCVGVPQKGKLATIFGWIPVSRWHATDDSPRPAARWVGVWQNETAKITVQAMGDGKLNIKGHAVRDLGPDGGNVEIYGDFSIAGRLEHGVVTSNDDSDPCKVSVRLVGDYLVAADNDACGGTGVTFAGMYRLRYH